MYMTKTFKRVGNGRMAASIKRLATESGVRVNHLSAHGWVLKDITIIVYGHASDIAKFEQGLPDGVQA